MGLLVSDMRQFSALHNLKRSRQKVQQTPDFGTKDWPLNGFTTTLLISGAIPITLQSLASHLEVSLTLECRILADTRQASQSACKHWHMVVASLLLSTKGSVRVRHSSQALLVTLPSTRCKLWSNTLDAIVLIYTRTTPSNV